MKKIEIPLYNDPPENLMQLEELEKIVLARMDVLDRFESRDRDLFKSVLLKPEYSASSIELVNHAKEDIASHFMLCVANCRADLSRTTYL